MEHELMAAIEGARRLARKDWHQAADRFETHPNAANYCAMLQCAADYQAASYELLEARKDAKRLRDEADFRRSRLYARVTA